MHFPVSLSEAHHSSQLSPTRKLEPRQKFGGSFFSVFALSIKDKMFFYLPPGSYAFSSSASFFVSQNIFKKSSTNFTEISQMEKISR